MDRERPEDRGMKTGWTWIDVLYASENSERRNGFPFWKFRTEKGFPVLEIQNTCSENSERWNDFNEGLRLWSIDSAGPIILDRGPNHPTTKREFYFLPGSRLRRSLFFPVGRPGVGGDRLTLGLFWGS
jgi:hypothetical protein